MKHPQLTRIELPHGGHESFELFWSLREGSAGEPLHVFPHACETLRVFLEEFGEITFSSGSDSDVGW